MDDLLQEFVAETRETLEALAGEIVAWEADPADRARLDAIFRFVHTVKGSCGFLDLPRLARLSHAAEDVLASVRDGDRTPDLALVNAVLAIVDRIAEVVEAIDSGTALDDSADDLLVAALAEDAVPASHASSSTGTRAVSRSVRLSVELLDRMMSGMSDLVLARNELARRLRDEGADPAVEASLERLSQTLADMRDTVTRTRMQKIDALFAAIPRMVRDTATELGKHVQLQVAGSDVELDREMIELMRDPLVHIIRNAVDHGLEDAADRRRAGKPEAGRLFVSARQSGNQILIEIADDGRGIDVGRLVAKAVQQKLHSEAEIARMTEGEKLDLIFAAGLSSRDVVTAVSGRGVGMDVVRANIEQIGGRIALANRPGQGLTIVIHVPLTLSIISTIIVGAGNQRFALARQAIEEIVRVGGAGVRLDRIGDADVATVRGRRLPLVTFGRLAGLGDAVPDVLAVVATREGEYALGLDAVLDTEELVVKPAAPAVMATGLYAGQTLPDSGLPMLLLDGAGIAAVAGLSFHTAVSSGSHADAVVETGTPALLFQDLDGQHRAIALAVIDRVEQVDTAAIRRTGGRLRLVSGDNTIPLHAVASLDALTETALLRLTDGDAEIGYAIIQPIDIVTLPAALAPATVPGIAGVAVIGAEQVEVIDPLALFAGEISSATVARPLCLLHSDAGGWMDSFLRPAVEAAGYRCVSTLAPGEQAAVALAMDDADAVPDGATPVVRLRRSPAGPDNSIYRYDRAGLLAAMAIRAGRGL
jgi:two-component system, chemotaxis family, sensor kinase CheA